MSLEKFLSDCRKKGSIPLSYRSEIVTLDGKHVVKYINPIYAKALLEADKERPYRGRVEEEY